MTWNVRPIKVIPCGWREGCQNPATHRVFDYVWISDYWYHEAYSQHWVCDEHLEADLASLPASRGPEQDPAQAAAIRNDLAEKYHG